MKKAIKIACIAIPALIIVVLIVVFFALNSAVKAGVERVLPKVTGTPVKLDDVSISLFSGKGELSGFLIGNPEGFETDSAFALGLVRVDVNLLSLMSDRIIIEEIYIDGAEVTYEAGLTGSNIGKIKKNIEEFAGPPKEGEEPKEKEGEGKKIQINRFVFTNATIALSAKGLQGRKLSVPLPEIELKDIGKEEGGKSIGEVANEIFTPLSNRITSVATEGLASAKKLVEEGAETA